MSSKGDASADTVVRAMDGGRATMKIGVTL
jgi:hypothetical protein